ncbi:MAG TPA: HAMP domain-containing sensor histidine kinase [Chitinophagales bacterium]|nr:HAMP domain-containing sensor histidine kinase [Chitinophagales bacterium]
MKRFAEYWHGLLLITGGVLMAWYCFHVHPAEPTKALAKAQRTFDAELRSFHAQTDSLYRTFTDPSSTIDAARAEELFNLPFAVLAYRGDSLVYWSHNTLLPSVDAIRSAQGYSLQRWKNGFYLLRNIELQGGDASQPLIRYAFVKAVKYDYATTNEYLRPGYALTLDVDQHIDLSTDPVNGGLRVALPDGNAFYIVYNPASSDSQTVFRLYLFFLVACLMIVAGIYTLVQPALRAMPFTSRLLIHAAFIYALHFVFHLVNPVPQRFLEWDIFNPNYYASPFVAGSLGTLFIELVLICYASVRWYLSATERSANEPHRWYFTLLQSAVVIATGAAATLLVRSLVLDSNIRFEFFNPFMPDYKNLLAVITIVTVLICFLFIALPVGYHMSRRPLASTLGIAALTVALGALVARLAGVEAFAILFFAGVCLVPLLLQYLLSVRSILEGSITSLFLFLIFLSGSFAMVLHHYNLEKELDLRLSYARKLVNERDNVTEYLLGEIRAPILSDPSLRLFFERPQRGVAQLTEWLDRQYFGDGFNRFDVKYHFYTSDGLPMATAGDETAVRNEELIGNSEVCGEHELYFLNQPLGSFTYIAEYPIRRDDALLGTLMVQLTSKVYKAVNVYPELLLEEKNKLPTSNYAFAIYNNNLLTEHNGAFVYPAYVTAAFGPATELHTFTSNDFRHLVYKPDETKTVVVSLPSNLSQRLLSYFSYLFIILFIGLSLAWAGLYVRAWLRRRSSIDFLNTASFRTFIQISFFLIIFSAVLVIGLFTGRFFVTRFNDTTESRLNEKLRMVVESTDFMLNETMRDTTVTPERALLTLRENVARLSSIQDIDINFYSPNGDLITTSQPAIFEKGLISRKINPRALYLLSNQSLSHLVQSERVGELTYLSGYQPLRMADGATLAYVNLPFFNTTRDLNEQIGMFFASLTTILVFALIVAGLLAPLISQRITRRLNIIAEKFKQVTLGRKNEAIEWHTRDELGTLVDEFNKMIYKLEQSANMLAKSERESAWREMAKQVAHEIKNPLTPMKLSIQHLQRAYKNGSPHRDELAERVSNTLIEQIENLSRIASEFSSFAKMPVSENEVMPVEDVVRSSVELYNENETVNVSFKGCDDEPCVLADRGQLLRVFNNLVLNAIQAIPEGRDGLVDVKCMANERFVKISITDNGIGIPGEEAEKVFVPNFTTKSSGTGLGLAISRNIVEGFGGRIWFRSNAPLDGTTFMVELPRHS